MMQQYQHIYQRYQRSPFVARIAKFDVEEKKFSFNHQKRMTKFVQINIQKCEAFKPAVEYKKEDN